MDASKQIAFYMVHHVDKPEDKRAIQSTPEKVRTGMGAHKNIVIREITKAHYYKLYLRDQILKANRATKH